MLVNNFLNNLRVENKSENTIINYSIDLAEFKQYFNQMKNTEININTIKNVTILDLDEYLLYLQQKEKKGKRLSDSTRARKVNALKSFFKYLYKKEIIEKNIARNISAPKIGEKIPIFLTLSDSAKLINGIKSVKNKTIVVFLLNIGLRISELISINTTDIQPDHSLQIIGKGNKQRHVKLNSMCVNQLKEFLAVRKAKDNEIALFTSKDGVRMSVINAQKLIKREVLNVLGTTNISAHKLRHSFCTMMFEAGVDTKTLKEAMGHKDIKTTEIYTHLSKKHIDMAFEKNPLSISANN